MQDFLWHLIAGAYLFAAAGFAFAWSLYLLLSTKIERLWERVTNHQQHEIGELKRRLDELEKPR